MNPDTLAQRYPYCVVRPDNKVENRFVTRRDAERWAKNTNLRIERSDEPRVFDIF